MKIKNRNNSECIKDERRKIIPLISTDDADLVIIEIFEGNQTSWHYHKKTIEIFYVLKGSAKIAYQELDDGERKAKNEKIIRKGDTFCVETNVFHKLIAFSGTVKVLKVNLPTFNKSDIFTEI